MILTVTINPSIEKTAVIDGLEINKLNSITDYRMTLGSSAIYSAMIIKVLQGEPYVLGFTGGIGGRYIKNLMDKSRIKSDMLFKDEETRFVFNIIDALSGETTILADESFYLDQNDIKNYKHKLTNHVKDVTTIIINSNGEEDDIKKDIINQTVSIAKENCFKTVLSLRGSALRKNLDKSPFAVVINNSDLEELEISPIIDQESILLALKAIVISKGIKYLVFNDLEYIYFITKQKICAIKKENGNVSEMELIYKDLIVGVMGISISRKYQPERILKIIGGVINSFNRAEFPNSVSRKDIDEWHNKVKIIEVNNSRTNKVIVPH